MNLRPSQSPPILLARLTVIACVIVATFACRSQPLDREPVMLRLSLPPIESPLESTPRCRDFRLDKRALFGDLHVHTAYSLDANLRGTRLLPDDAYRFALGERVPIPPYGPQNARKLYIQLDRPLDFAAVTDHAEFLGVISMCEDASSPNYNRAGCKMYRNDRATSYMLMAMRLTNDDGWRRRPHICGTGAEDYCLEARRSMWQDIQAVAEQFYDRQSSCGFTTFVGYEWTATPGSPSSPANNLHRNVIFKNSFVPQLPADYFDYPTVDLFHDALQTQCKDADMPCDVLAIPHNSNLSGGLMFPIRDGDGLPMTRAYSERRRELEPLIEIYQHKGSSECQPGSLSGDEYCGFELLPYGDLAHAALDREDPPEHANFVRYALNLGMKLDAEFGANPYAYGIVASTDNHLGLPGAGYREEDFPGGGGASSLGDGRALPDQLYYSGGGLVGVWAEENSRPSIFSALTRREVFGTSGPRITPRTYIGWDLPTDACERGAIDWSQLTDGVPMGGELAADQISGHGGPPTIFVQASKDPGTAEHPGAPLERIQLIKGWIDADGQSQNTVLDVATSSTPPFRELPLSCGEPQGGASTLCAQFTDPTWDPSQHAYYYFRVLEVPTCRWSTAQCLAADFDCANPERPLDLTCCRSELGLFEPNCMQVDCAAEASDHPTCCSARMVEPRIRERAWTSPIWIRP